MRNKRQLKKRKNLKKFDMDNDGDFDKDDASILGKGLYEYKKIKNDKKAKGKVIVGMSDSIKPIITISSKMICFKCKKEIHKKSLVHFGTDEVGIVLAFHGNTEECE